MFNHTTRALIAGGLCVSVLATARGTVPQEQLAPGSVLRVTLEQDVRSGREKPGQEIVFRVASPAGTRATGRVLESQGRRNFGRSGKLVITCETVQLPDGRSVPVRLKGFARGEKHASGQGSEGAFATAGLASAATTAVGIVSLSSTHGSLEDLVGGLAILTIGMSAVVLTGVVGLFTYGHNVTLERGTPFEVEVLPGGNANPSPARAS